MAAVRIAGAATFEIRAVAKPTHDPASPMLREWSYRRRHASHPQPQVTTRSSSLPSRPGPVGRNQTPVAFAVKNEATTTTSTPDASVAMGGSRHPWLNAAAASAAAATAATISAAGDQIYQQSINGDADSQQQLQPVVATLVTNLACGLRSGIGNLVYAGVAEPCIEDAGDAVNAGHMQVMDPSTHQVMSLPPPPSALPDEHGLASFASEEATQEEVPPRVPLSATQPGASTPDEPSRDVEEPEHDLALSALKAPSVDHERTSQDHTNTHRERTGTGTDDSLHDWVINEYDEATFHVENGKLVEVRAPVPSVDYDEQYEEALLEQRKGMGCVRRPRRLLPPRRRTFAEFGLKEQTNDSKDAAEASPSSSSPPLGQSASERQIMCDDAQEEDRTEVAAAGKNRGNGKGRHPVARWMQRRRETRQQKLEKKIARHQASLQQPDHQHQEEFQSTITATNVADVPPTTEEDQGYDASASERSARVDPRARDKKAGGIVRRPRRSRSVPVRRRLAKSKSRKHFTSEVTNDEQGETKRTKSKRPKNFKKKSTKKAKRRRNRALRRRAVSLDDLVAAEEDLENCSGGEELEADSFGRLKPLPNDPRPAAASARSCPVAPIAQAIHRTCSTVASSVAAASSCVPTPRSQPLPHPVLAFAATATARVVGHLLTQQQQEKHHQKSAAASPRGLLPLTKILHGVPISALPVASPEEDNAAASSPQVPPAEAFHMLPPLPSASSDDDRDLIEDTSDDEDDEIATLAVVIPSSPSETEAEQEKVPLELRDSSASSEVESLLEDLTRVLDELEAYRGVDESMSTEEDGDDSDSDETAPSLAGTDTSSSQGSHPSPTAASPVLPRSVRRRVEMFESLRDTGVLTSSPKPHRGFNKGRSWTAPPAITVLPLPPPTAGSITKEQRGQETTVSAIHGDCMVVPRTPAPPSPSPLKVLFIGDKVGSIPGAADAARRLASHHRRLRGRRSSSGEDGCKAPAFEVLNGPGAGISFSHHATQSLFYSSDALCILFWDMALDDPKTYSRGRRRRRAGSDHSDEEDEDDHFAAEEASRRADRALERQADDDVTVWFNVVVDHLERSLERRPSSRGTSDGGGVCSILPVAVAPAGADEDEIRRRCDVLRCRLLRQCEERARRRRSSAQPPSPMPDLVFPGEGGTVLCVDIADGAEALRETVESVAAGRRRHVKAVPHSTLSPHPSDIGQFPSTVRHIVTELKQEHKVVAVSRIVTLLQQIVECDDTAAKHAVVETLRCLSEEGEVIYVEDTNKPIPSRTAAGARGTGAKEVGANKCENSLLDRFVILSPKWLSSAVSCIVRRDIRREVVETRNLMSSQVAFDNSLELQSDMSNMDIPLSSCPVITSDDVRLLWQSMSFMREASDDIAANSFGISHIPDPTLFAYLEKVLVQSRVFLPLRDQAEHSFLSKQQSSRCCDDVPTKCCNDDTNAKMSTLYLLPGLMTQDPPADIWTYKAKDSWSTTLCHSWLFRDGVPPGTMEHIIHAVLKKMLGNTYHCMQDDQTTDRTAPLRVHQVMVWRSAFILRLGMDVICPQSMERTESIIEIFGHLASASSLGPPCVATDSMGSKMKRLSVTAKGQAGDCGRKIWDGGLSLVSSAIAHALSTIQVDMSSIEGEIVCPECLSFQHPSEANTWKTDWVRSSRQNGHHHIRCGRGHHIETALVCGSRPESHTVVRQETKPLQSPVMPVSTLLDGVVVVGLWDVKAKQIKNVGSGFVADREKGLIATASHILFEMQSRDRFGQEFFGLKDAKVVIGVIPRSQSSKGPRSTTAVFRYFAEIVESDVRNCDACVLRITTRFDEDVGGDGEDCGDQPEVPLKNNVRAMKAEKLHQLKLTKKFELEEDVRILGYNQGGEGRLKPGSHVNRCADFARGYVCKNFKVSADEHENTGLSIGFNPLEETVVMCPTISGHSGGPCVNQEGAVIGILSRADPADKQRCYLVPAPVVKRLLKKAKAKCTMSPLDLYYR